MEWNANVWTATAATGSTSADAIVGTTAAPQAPTQMNAGAIEDYLISTNPSQQWNPKWTPGWIDEALAWKSLDEQIDIINKLDSIVDNTNRNPNFIDAAWVQRDLQQQQQQAPQQQQQQQQQEWPSLADRIAALEQAQIQKDEQTFTDESSRSFKVHPHAILGY